MQDKCLKLSAYLTDDVFLPDVAEGTATPGLNSVDQSIRNLYLFKKEVFGDAQDDGFWFASYNRIYYYNTVIDNIMNADGSDEQQKLSIRAEALISRALEYLYLVNGYAKYYDVRTAESDPGVPLILDEDISKKNFEVLPRHTSSNLIKNCLFPTLRLQPLKPQHNYPYTNTF